MIAMIGTSDQSCWQAEACKILLLLCCVFCVKAEASAHFLRLKE